MYPNLYRVLIWILAFNKLQENPSILSFHFNSHSAQNIYLCAHYLSVGLRSRQHCHLEQDKASSIKRKQLLPNDDLAQSSLRLPSLRTPPHR